LTHTGYWENFRDEEVGVTQAWCGHRCDADVACVATSFIVSSGTSACYLYSHPVGNPIPHSGGMACAKAECPTSVMWYISTSWSGSCDDVCERVAGTCSQSALNSLGLSQTNMQPRLLKQAYEGATGEGATGANLQCNSWNTGCAGGSCQSWGLPFIHVDHFNHKECWGGDAVASCAQQPIDHHHRRLCPCQASTDTTTTSQSVCRLVGDFILV
jgi:hypothetical protein